MPSLNLTSQTLSYTAADKTALQKAVTLLDAIAKYDDAVKLDATTALNAVKHVLEHVVTARAN